MRIRSAAIWLSVFSAFLPGCGSPQAGVARQEAALAGRMTEEIDRVANLGGEKISWKEALELMTARNIELQASRDNITASEEALKQIYRDLIPGASISAGVTSAFTDVANLSGDDFALNIFTFINLPGLISHRVRYYAATLEVMRARWAYEQRLRELTIALHEQFLQYQLLAERSRNLALSSRFQPVPNILNGLDATPEGLAKEEISLSLERQARTMQAGIARLLGSSRSRWEPDADSLPEWDYLAKPLPLRDPGKFGTLFRQLQALQLEGQRLAKLGVKLRYWPDIRISLSSPPLYSVSGGNQAGFDVDRVLVRLDSSVRLDTNLTIWTQLKQLERRVELDRRRLSEENSILIEQLMANQKALDLNRKQRRLNEIRLKSMRNEQRSLDLQKTRDQLEKSLALSERRASLLLERAQLQGSLWLFDERRWDRIRWDEPEKEVRR